MLNSLDKSTETRILATIEESNPDLAEQIRELMFTFEDMVLIDSRGMQVILKEMPKEELVMAMKTASEPIKELIYSSMSQRASEMLREDLEVLGPVKVADVERSQQTMVKIARRLEEEGKVVIGGRGGGEVV
jgi:flagellar motor switch protein FliG